MELDQLSPGVWGVAGLSLIAAIVCTVGVSLYSKHTSSVDRLNRRIETCLRYALYSVWVVVAPLGLMLLFGVGYLALWTVALLGTAFLAAIIIGVSVIPIARSFLSRDQCGMKGAGYFLISLSALWLLSATLYLMLVVDMLISWPFVGD